MKKDAMLAILRPKDIRQFALLAAFACFPFLPPPLRATSNYTYKPGEYVVVADGRSPDGQYSIAAHGDGDEGYDNFHIYLMDARSGRKIGPLEEIKDTLDTGADAFHAQWSADSHQVSISYRVDRRVVVVVRYRVDGRRAFRISGPTTISGR